MAALAGSDIQTNPPATNDAVAASGVTFERKVDVLPPTQVLSEVYGTVDFAKMEEVLMEQGIAKFAQPQHELLALIGEKRQQVAGA